MHCFRCGTLVADGTRFCAQCGADVSAESKRLASEERRAGDGLLDTVRARLADVYDVERELGRGGMAVVMRAVERELRRPVALKVMPPQLSLSAESAERFKREARLMASLDHPNVIPIYRVGEVDGLLYIAMKLVEGKAVDDIVRDQGPLPIPTVIAILHGAAAGLAAAHERGIIHRDVKGGNILVDRDGRVLVTDFGIARAMEDVHLTASGMIVGTPHFMSPEQCAGRPLGPQSDQYSLAAVAFQMLTGSVPFDADSLPAVMQHHFFTPAPDPATMRAGIPRALDVVVRRALAKKPEDRFPSTRDMVEAIDAIPQTADERRQAEEMLRTLARGGALPRITAAAAPTMATLAPIGAAGDMRLSRIVGAARARLGVRGGAVFAIAAVLVALIVGGVVLGARAYFGPNATTRRAVQLYETGRLDDARAAFIRLANDYPRLAVPHIYLGRIARDGRQYGMAQRELQAAIQLEPGSAVALREMGSLMYVTGRFPLAERFYRHALDRDPTDALARGYLGCSLVHEGRVTEGRSIMIQAGEGSWSRCG